jgi:hypothetical protein
MDFCCIVLCLRKTKFEKNEGQTIYLMLRLYGWEYRSNSKAQIQIRHFIINKNIFYLIFFLHLAGAWGGGVKSLSLSLSFFSSFYHYHRVQCL